MSLEDIEGNLQSMAELAKANGIRVVLGSVMPVSDYIRPQTTRRPNEKIKQLNNWIRRMPKNGHVYLDYWPALQDEAGVLKKEYTYDGLHPNNAGYDAIRRQRESRCPGARAIATPERKLAGRRRSRPARSVSCASCA